jgi:hypothetical protein
VIKPCPSRQGFFHHEIAIASTRASTPDTIHQLFVKSDSLSSPRSGHRILTSQWPFLAGSGGSQYSLKADDGKMGELA